MKGCNFMGYGISVMLFIIGAIIAVLFNNSHIKEYGNSNPVYMVILILCLLLAVLLAFAKTG